MIEAAKKIAGATDGSGEVKIGEVGTANNKGAAANQESVNGIADGMKEIVDAGGKDALKAAGAGAGADNNEAGKLFGGTNGNAGASDDDIGKAAAAVNAVSGEQILKAIVDAAGGDKVGAAAGAATNPIAAAIGTNAQGADFGAGGMQNSSDKIAAAIVLRGMAKNGKFSLAAQNNDQKAKVKSVVHQKKMIEAAKKIAGATDGEVKIGEVGTEANKGAAADQASVNGIADGMKEIVAAGGKDALKAGAAAAGGADNKEAGKLFGGTNGNAGANDNDIGKAAAAVNAVSGEQILKAIVDAAGGDNKDGAAAGDANNPIAAAIGTDAAQGADFGAGGGMQNSSDKIAAAIVLRGMAKDGKFSLAAHNDANQKAKVKSEDGRGCKEDCGGY